MAKPTIQFIGKHDVYEVPEYSARVHQVHGNRTIVVREPQHNAEQADGMITDIPGLTLITKAADCQNFAIYAPEKNIAGVLHVGWRGLLAKAIPAFFDVAEQEFGVPAKAFHVFAGPSLCKQCADFTDPVAELPDIDPQYISGNCVDLQQVATDQFLACGVQKGSLKRQEYCTRCNPQQYWTYRGGDRESVKSGSSNILVCTLNT